MTASLLASFGADDGTGIKPAMDRVAWLAGRSVRAIQYHVEKLRELRVLEETRKATQWSPAHYRLRVENLPARPPYRSVSGVQPIAPLNLLEGSVEPGVQPGAPRPGVQPSAPGVQPGAPDPYVRSDPGSSDPGSDLDPTVHTRTARAREGALPLVGASPGRSAAHREHAYCDHVRGKCVPKFLHREFIKALNGRVHTRPQRLRAFYEETIAAIPPSMPLLDEPVKFWRRALAAAGERFGAPTPAAAARMAPERSPRRQATSYAVGGDDAWSEVLRHVEGQLNRNSFYTWFRETRLARDGQAVLEVVAPSETHAQWIERHYAGVLEQAVMAVRPGTRIVFVAPPAQRKQG